METTLRRVYTDTSDNPALTVETLAAAGVDPEKTTTTRYLPGLTGDLTATHTLEEATTELMLADPHGDITATLTLPATGTPAGIDTWHDTDEYGNPRPGTPTGATPAGYGWHGTKERSTDTPAGLTLMGARLYNPTTAHFTSVDPVPGGGQTAYAYPFDPINEVDLDGKRWSKKDAWNWVKRNKWNIALAAAGLIPGVGAAVWAVRAGVFATRAVQASRVGLALHRSRTFGYSSRLFGDKFTAGGRQGLLNRGKSSAVSLGWSGRGYLVNGKRMARTVLRARVGKVKINIAYGPWR